MSHRILIPTPLKRFAGNVDAVDVEAATVKGIIDQLEDRYPGFRGRLCDEGGQLRRFINVYVNGEDVRFLENLATPVPEGAEVSIIPAIAGG
ncbi:MAG: ubiquitin-like small modifier protein 1 [Terriglobia bacterium]|jgi:molybdopterin synthase sulfur carrier subunit